MVTRILKIEVEIEIYSLFVPFLFSYQQNGMTCKAFQLELEESGDPPICGDGKCVDVCESPGYKCKCDNDTHVTLNDGTCEHKTRNIFMIITYLYSRYTNIFLGFYLRYYASINPPIQVSTLSDKTEYFFVGYNFRQLQKISSPFSKKSFLDFFLVGQN